jgi:hypothetical protein
MIMARHVRRQYEESQEFCRRQIEGSRYELGSLTNGWAVEPDAAWLPAPVNFDATCPPRASTFVCEVETRGLNPLTPLDGQDADLLKDGTPRLAEPSRPDSIEGLRTRLTSSAR